MRLGEAVTAASVSSLPLALAVGLASSVLGC
jgi:hypothetical protein